MNILLALFLTLGGLTSVYVLQWAVALYQSRALVHGAPERVAAPGVIRTIIGFATNFFDTLGIGSFATTTSAYKQLLALF